MKKLLSTTAIVLAFGTTAFAADLPSRKAPVYAPPPPPPVLWTGLYGGLNAGGGWSANNGGQNSLAPYIDPAFPAGGVYFLPGGQTSNTNGGVVGGGQIGYNYQFGNSFVVGVETDFQGSSIGSGNQGSSASLYASPVIPGDVLVPLAGGGGNLGLQWFGTVRGRAGFLITPTLLIYGTGGFAYGKVTALNWSNTNTGWTAGGGVEWMFLPNWSAKVEYLYTDLSSNNSGNGNWGSYTRPQFNIVRAGVNYHFNWGAPAPILAKF